MTGNIISLVLSLTLMCFQGFFRVRGTIEPQKGGQTVSDPWTADELMKPETLKDVLSSGQKEKLFIIYAGPPVLFKVGHVPGAISVGQVSDSSGVRGLKEALKKISKNKQIILYCGCCPIKNCPNIRPAYKVIHQMGFTKIKVLYLPNSFKIDWIKKGLATEK
jgi:thiosulfate/3-mercaptopyruvate sulfurtransferase